MGKMIFKAKFICSLPLKAWDNKETCFSWIKIFHGSNGHVYYYFDHENWSYCPIKNIPNEYCEHNCPCSECPETEHFIDFEGVILPVRCLTMR
jgi:hypothetical protein